MADQLAGGDGRVCGLAGSRAAAGDRRWLRRDAAGEDRFDCVLGVLCVLNVLAGNRPDTAPADPWIRRWEGWVLGQTALPAEKEMARPAGRAEVVFGNRHTHATWTPSKLTSRKYR